MIAKKQVNMMQTIQKFFILEGGYLIVAVFILLVTIFVTTRPFMPKGALKKGVGIVSLILAFFIGAHFYITTSRMAEVQKAFEEGKPVICESRMLRKAAQSIIISKEHDWRIEGDMFVSPHYNRPFHTARCIVK
jgi:hypothetical protein